MKKLIAFLFCCTAFVAGSALASPVGSAPEGFTGPGSAVSPPVTSAREAKSMRDDTRVVMRGHIVQQLGKDKYLFKDASGTIQVEIDDDKWRGLSVTPDDIVEIRGEIDADWKGVEVDVDSIVKL